tara:strand:- start:2091 stop:2912 length:822 start_codon:yes stop_codon:yes gene_type:complete
MINRRESILVRDNYYPTGEIPVIVQCTDLLTWVCKHCKGNIKTQLNELLGSSFASEWNLKTPEPCIITVDPNLVPKKIIPPIQPIFFQYPCFASLHNSDYLVIDETIIPQLNDAGFRSQIERKNDFLKICLFDIWLCNEDRCHNNTNLILDQTIKGKFRFTVFDHGALFNTSNLSREIALITEEDSLISSDFASALFRSKHKMPEITSEVVKDFYFCVSQCQNNLEQIFDNIPSEWSVNKEQLAVLLNKSIFTSEWLKQCEAQFRFLIQKFLS